MVSKYTNPNAHWRWRGPFASGQDFLRGDVSRDGEWLMWAGADTEDRPAPQPIGDAVWILPEVPAWGAQQVSSSVLLIGQRYTFDLAGYLRGVRMWLPAAAVGLGAELWMVTNPETAPDYIALVPGFEVEAFHTDSWLEFPVGLQLVSPGLAFDLVLVLRPRTGQTSFTYTWDYVRANGSPGTGQAFHHSGNNQHELWFHQEDYGGVNRSSDLDNLGPGSTIWMAESGMEWDILAVTKNGAVYEFDVQPAARAGADLSDFTFTYYGVLPIDYVRLDDHWPANPPHGDGTWLLQEQSGTVAFDSSGNSNDMAWVSGSFATHLTDGPGGNLPSAISLAGNNDWIQDPDIFPTPANVLQYSASCWCRMSGITTRQSLFGQDTNSTPRAWSLRTTTAGEIELFAAATGNVGVDGYHMWRTPSIADGNWHQVGFTFDAGVVQFYVDGLPATSTDHSVNNPPNTFSLGVAFGIGSRGGSALDFYAGDICDVRIYPRVLSAAEMAYLALLDTARANVRGLYSTSNYADLVLSQHAYGVDLQVQNLHISPDWQIMARSAV